MAEKTTIARPYAQAMFDIARAKSVLSKIDHALQLAAIVVTDPSVAALVGNPKVSKSKLAELVTSIGGSDAGGEFSNFIHLLAENGRLSVLPEIAQLFAQYRAEQESTIEAEVISASALNDSQKQAIIVSLKKRLGREVTLQCSTDESLIGGAVIRAGDLVIDGSITTQLNKLALAVAR
jgi:F-type H+-transporting ATPase subunit delta